MSAPGAPHPNGISLAGFLALIDAHGGRAAFYGLSTGAVKHKIILPITAHKRKSYAEQLLDTQSPHPHVAPASTFISHAYDDEFLGAIDAIAALEAREGSSAFYYFDLLVVNQHGQGAVVPFEVLRDEFGESVRAIGRTLLYLRWENPTPLGRAWCVFEMGTTLAMGTGLKVIMPPADVAAFKRALVEDFDSLTFKTCRVDVEKASAREASDLANIKRAIVEGGGFLKTNQLVIGAMQGWMVEEAQAALDAMPVEERATSALINNLANLLSDQGKLGEAEPLYREALAGRRRSLGDEHPSTLTSINNLAILLSDQGKLVEAEPLYREALAGKRRTLGDEHSSTLNSINNLANLLSDIGDNSSSEALYMESLPTCRRVLGDTHRLTFLLITGLATCLRRAGRLDEALPLAREAFSVRCTLLGADQLETAYSAHELGVVLRLLGAPARALPHALAAHETFLRIQGAASRLTLSSQLSLALLQGDAALQQRLRAAGALERFGTVEAAVF
jgi:tetratricopeptide (TPR) repeat protein